MLGENVFDAFQRIGAGGGRQRALDDGDLVGFALARLYHGLGVAFADLDPVGADKGRAAIVRAHVDLDDVDAFVLRALQQLGIGLHVRIMDHHHRRLFRDQRGHRLGAGIGAPVRVAHDHLDAVGFEFILETRKPALGQVEIHRDRNVGYGLAGQRLLEGALKRFVETLLRQRRRGCRSDQADPEQQCLQFRQRSCRHVVLRL